MTKKCFVRPYAIVDWDWNEGVEEAEIVWENDKVFACLCEHGRRSYEGFALFEKGRCGPYFSKQDALVEDFDKKMEFIQNRVIPRAKANLEKEFAEGETSCEGQAQLPRGGFF